MKIHGFFRKNDKKNELNEYIEKQIKNLENEKEKKVKNREKKKERKKARK